MKHDTLLSAIHRIRHQMGHLWEQIHPVVTSDDAMRLYALAALAIVTAIAGVTAFGAKRELTRLKDSAINLKFPGPDPVKEDSRRKRLAALEARAEEELEPFRRALWVLLAAGFLVPTIVFAMGTIFYGWFDPSGAPFVSLADNRPLHSAGNTALAWFAFNQFSHGALFDALEVFDINIAAVSNNPHNYWFSGAVLLYRSMVSAFVVALAIGIAQFLYVKNKFDRMIRDEVDGYTRPDTTPAPVAEAA